MLAKRKFQNFVNTYSDQSIGGKKTFTENLVVTGECTIPDSTFDHSSIPESAIVSTTGWIFDTFTALIGSVSDLVNDLTNNTFGYLKNTDIIPQNQIDDSDPNGWISSYNRYLFQLIQDLYAPSIDPTFSGTVTFIDTSVTPNTSTTITDYLQISTAASTYAPKASPTFSGTVTFPDTSTIS